MKAGFRIGAAIAGICLVALVAVFVWLVDESAMTPTPGSPLSPPGAIPLAVLGDSNSHSYQDGLSFPPSSQERGGLLRPRTFQWTEVLARLRPGELDQGPWGVWGQHERVVLLRDWLGLDAYHWPRKEDYRYNFAFSGASCADLLSSRQEQGRRLVRLMDSEPERWKRGVVVIRMGLNDWKQGLDLQARDPAAPEVQATTALCVTQIGGTIALIRARHPSTRVLVVGIGNVTDAPGSFGHFASPAEVANIAQALGSFNGALRGLASAYPQVAFFDDQEWFRARWGSPPEKNSAAYKAVDIGKLLHVTNSSGDDPNNFSLADTHFGLAANTLWAQALVARLNEAFDLKVKPISDKEVLRFLAATIETPARAPGL